MDLKYARSPNIDGFTHVPTFCGAKEVGLGDALSQSVLKSVYGRIMESRSFFVAHTSSVHLGGIDMEFHAVSFSRLPQPIKRKCVQLKCSDLALAQAADVPGLSQFLGNIDDQYLYFIEHPENIFLAHMGRIIAYSNR